MIIVRLLPYTLHKFYLLLLLFKGERLALTLRFMADTTSYPGLQAAFVVSRHTICKIVPEVCDAIIEAFAPVLSCPETEREWWAVADRLQSRWNFSHCIGNYLINHYIQHNVKTNVQYIRNKTVFVFSRCQISYTNSK